MKRVIAIFITVVYLLPAIGYSINVHWCGKRITAISYSSFKAPKCNSCSAPRKCCKTTHTIVKLKDIQHGSASVKAPFANSFVSTISVAVTTFSYNNAGIVNPQYYHPPPCGDVPVYLANSVFRI